MRVGRALAAGLVGLGGAFGIILMAGPALAEPPKPFGRVTVDPQSGPPTTLIAVQYQQIGTLSCKKGTTITFKWDGHGVRQAPLNITCGARSTFIPPAGDRKPGPHQVTAWDGGTALGGTVFLVTQVDPSGSPSSPPSASPTPSRSKGVKPSPSDDPTFETDPPLPTDNGPSVDGTQAAAGAAAGGGGGSSSGGGGPSPMGVALAFGGALVLGGVGILGYIVVKGRRYEPELALADSPTQPIPGFPGSYLAPAVDPYAASPATLFEPRPATPPGEPAAGTGEVPPVPD